MEGARGAARRARGPAGEKGRAGPGEGWRRSRGRCAHGVGVGREERMRGDKKARWEVGEATRAGREDGVGVRERERATWKGPGQGGGFPNSLPHRPSRPDPLGGKPGFLTNSFSPCLFQASFGSSSPGLSCSVPSSVIPALGSFWVRLRARFQAHLSNTLCAFSPICYSDLSRSPSLPFSVLFSF